MLTSVGARIREARQARGLTQNELATVLGVTRSAVAQWETGRAGQESAMLPRIAEALAISPGWLLAGDEVLSVPAGTGMQQMRDAQGDELALIRLYRACAPEDRALLLRTARRLARA